MQTGETMKHLRELEKENTRLKKKIVAEQAVDIRILKEEVSRGSHHRQSCPSQRSPWPLASPSPVVCLSPVP
jgi:hypothetical protein